MDFEDRDQGENVSQQMEGSSILEPKQEQDVSTQTILARLGLANIHVYSEASIEQLVLALEHPDWEKRASAATALGKVHTSVPIDPLVAALKDESEAVRAAAARTLGQLGKPAPIAVLEYSLGDSSPLVREAVLTAIGNMGIALPLNHISIALKDEDDSVRAAAAYALGRLKALVPPSLLAPALHDSSMLVREAAAIALGRLATPDALLFLIVHLIKEEEALVRDAIIDAMYWGESKSVKDFVKIAFQADTLLSQNAARKAIKALVDLGSNIHEEIAPGISLTNALQNINKRIQKAITVYLVGRAFDALNEQISLAPSVEMLRLFPNDTTTQEGIWRTFESFAQRMLQDRKRIRLLLTVLSDEDKTIRDEVAGALHWLVQMAFELLRERVSIDGLQKALDSSEGRQRSVIIRYLVGQGLGALGERENLDSLFVDLCDHDIHKKVIACQALCKRAKKAYMGRVPSGTLVISLNNTQGATPLEVQFGSTGEPVHKEGRLALPWNEPLLQEKHLSGILGSLKVNLVNTTFGNVCCH